MLLAGFIRCSWIVLIAVLTITDAQQNYWFKPVPTTTLKPSNFQRATPMSNKLSTLATTKSTTTTTTTTTGRPSPVGRRSSSVIFPADEDWNHKSTDNKMPAEIPLSLLQKLNEADSWQDFLKFVENVTVIEGEEEGDPLTVVGAWETVDGRTGAGGERDSSIQAKVANCIPELQTVPLVSNEDPSVLFYPTCTRIERCGGCCSSELLACEPVKQETVLLQVMKTQYSGGNKVKFAGKEIVPVQKHLTCKCQCKVKESDCNRNQNYVPGACRCECTNFDDRRKCESENQTRFWDSRECACRCRDSAQQCSTGFYFNDDVCRCDPWISRRSETGVRAVLGEDGRLPGNFEDPIYHSDDNNDKKPSSSSINNNKWKDHEEEDDPEKVSRPTERYQFVNNFNRNRNNPALARV